MARFFVDRPIFAWVLSIVIVVAGLSCVLTLPIAQYPPIVPPNIQVSCSYPGANAKIVADTVAQPIEEQVNGVPGMIYMSSTCTNNGMYTLNVTFKLGTDIQTALMLVQTRVQLAMPQLPPTVQAEGINYRMQSPNILLVANLISRDGQYDTTYLSNYAQIRIYDRLSRLDGVAAVNILGQRQYSMRAWIDPQKLAALDLTCSDVVNAIKEQNVEIAAGNIGQQPVPPGQMYQLAINTKGRLTTPREFGAIVVKVGKDGRIVHLRDVARLELGAQNYDLDCVLTYTKRDAKGNIQRTNGKPELTPYPSIGMAVYQLPEANALAVGDKVKQLMEEVKKDFPKGLDYVIAHDTTPYIKHSVEDVFNTLIIAAILVVIVVLIFLQDWRAMLLPIIDIIVSLIGTLAVMALFGFSLNNLSLFGMVLAIGILVDDSIVVVENIERWMGTGINAREATLQAMAEITGPVVGITLVLCSVFIPAAFIPGLTGQFFKQFALTIAASTVISATNAMTMAPARACAWIKPHKHGETREALPRIGIVLIVGYLFALLADLLIETLLGTPTRWEVKAILGCAGAVGGWYAGPMINRLLASFFGVFNRAFDAVTSAYTRAVGMLLRVSAIVLAGYGGLLFLTYVGFATSPTGFIPEQDQGYLMCQVELPPSASVQRTSEVLTRISEICLETPGVNHTLAIGGFSVFYQCDSSNWGTVFIVLEDFEKRTSPKLQAVPILIELNRRVREEIMDANVVVFGAPAVPGLGQGSGFQLQIEDEAGLGLQTLQEVTDAVVEKANQQPGLRQVFSSFRNDSPQLYVEIDREKAKQMGVTLGDVFDTLTIALGSLYINQFNEFDRIWQVNIQALGAFRQEPDQIKLLKVKNREGQAVPIASVVDIRFDTGPVFIMRYNDNNSAAIIGNSAPGFSSGQAISLMEQLWDRAKPPGMRAEWTNIAYQETTAGNTGLLIFALGVLLVFLVLSALYENWSLPLAIILVVPMCLLCSIAGLVWIAHKPVDIFAQIGFVVLVAMAAKNAILLVEFARDKHAEGATYRDAMLEACKTRLRPILMTSAAFIMGVYPLVVAVGAGWEMRRSLGTAVFSGMIGVTLFGIFLTPVFYYVITWITDRPASASTPDAPRDH